jgi:hypothetical protein
VRQAGLGGWVRRSGADGYLGIRGQGRLHASPCRIEWLEPPRFQRKSKKLTPIKAFYDFRALIRSATSR